MARFLGKSSMDGLRWRSGSGSGMGISSRNSLSSRLASAKLFSSSDIGTAFGLFLLSIMSNAVSPLLFLTERSVAGASFLINSRLNS